MNSFFQTVPHAKHIFMGSLKQEYQQSYSLGKVLYFSNNFLKYFLPLILA